MVVTPKTSKIAVWWHGLFYRDEEFLPNAMHITESQMDVMEASGLTGASEEIYCCVNGSYESMPYAETVFPYEAVKVYHGLQCKTELRTLMHMQETMKGREGWKVLYWHCKGAFHKPDDRMCNNWRNCMTHHLVAKWPVCVDALNGGYDCCGTHWLTEQVDGKQALFGGNFWWSTSEFLNTLPPIENHPRIALQGGVDDVRSRYESEVWIGTGPRLPKVRDFHPGWPFKCPER